jgi:DNA-binding MarR family transcriptional regulator
MDGKKEALIGEGWAFFTRLLLKSDFAERQPVDFGGAVKLNAAHIHIIEAIGKEYGNTVTSLSGYFRITKGAVSQIVTKLFKAGFIRKIKRKGNDKEIILELTPKGWKAFAAHEKRNEASMRYLIQTGKKYSEREIRSFLTILKEIDRLFDGFPAGAQNR